MKLADRFAAAPFEEGGWDIALKALASATRSSRGNLLALADRHLRFNWITDMPDGLLEQQSAIDGFRPETNYRLAAASPPMELRWETHYDVFRKQAAFEPYCDLTRRVGGEHGAQVVLADQDGAFFGLAVLRDEHEGRTTEEDRRVLKDAAPHVLSAIRLQSALEHQGCELLCGSLDAMKAATVLIDGTGRVCGFTSGVEPVLSGGEVCITGSTLQMRRHDLDAQLQRQIAIALRNHRTGERHDIPGLCVPSPAGPIFVTVTALPRRAWSLGFAPAVLVALRMPVNAASPAPAALIKAFGLTPAEADVVFLLARGMSRKVVAEARGTSLQTVVSQLRTIFQKCQVRRESELVCLARTILEPADDRPDFPG